MISTWEAHPEFPFLQLISHRSDREKMGREKIENSNIHFIHEYLPQEELISIQNECGIHVCPSITEGYGYYIAEGLSIGAVVITTDAPPMNEFVVDKRCLVKYNGTKPWQKPYYYATGYYVDQQDLSDVIANLLALPEEELQEIGRRNREFFLERDLEFRKNMAELFTRKQVFDL